MKTSSGCDTYRGAVLREGIEAVLGRVQAYEGAWATRPVRLNRERSDIADLLRRMAERPAHDHPRRSCPGPG